MLPTVNPKFSQQRWRFWQLLVQLLLLVSWVASHGHLSSPKPRGYENVGFMLDSLNAPNTGGTCRDEKFDKDKTTVTAVTPGQDLTLGFTITARHVGLCTVNILDSDLGNPVEIAALDNCASPPRDWTVTLPSDMTGRKVLQWKWVATHISKENPENYENCADLDFGGSSSGNGNGNGKSNGQASAGKSPAVAPTPAKTTPSAGNTSGNTSGGSGSGSPPISTPPPAPSPAQTSPTPATSGSGKECEPGHFACRGGRDFVQCDNGNWVRQACGEGSVCTPSGNYILCSH